MATSQRHKLCGSKVTAPPAVLFDLLSDMPNYRRWLPRSGQFGETTDVEPYPVRLGSRYHDGKPGLDIAIPLVLLPPRPLILRNFDR